MKFSVFVQEMASACELDVDHISIDKIELADNVNQAITSIVNIVKPKLDRLDSIELPFIENAFTDKALSKLRDNETSVDYVITKMSCDLFGIEPSKLTSEQANIIKVLVAYIVLQFN